MRVLPFYGFRILAWVPVLLDGMFDIPSSCAFVHDGLAAAVQVLLHKLLEQIMHFFGLAHGAADEDLTVEVLQGGVVLRFGGQGGADLEALGNQILIAHFVHGGVFVGIALIAQRLGLHGLFIGIHSHWPLTSRV